MVVRAHPGTAGWGFREHQRDSFCQENTGKFSGEPACRERAQESGTEEQRDGRVPEDWKRRSILRPQSADGLRPEEVHRGAARNAGGPASTPLSCGVSRAGRAHCARLLRLPGAGQPAGRPLSSGAELRVWGLCVECGTPNAGSGGPSVLT